MSVHVKQKCRKWSNSPKQIGDDIVILAVNIDPQLDVQGFVDENKITFPILLDTDDKVNETYQIISIPTTYFIDSKGIIQNKYTEP